MTGHVDVTGVAICVATFRRPGGLRRLLEGLASQSYRQGPPPRVTVIVVDNDEASASRTDREDAVARLGLDLRYIAEPRPGIPYARNAALDAATASHDWLCFIDDDEVPTEFWLDGLLATQRRTGAECVAGEVVPVFPPDTPAWIVRGPFFGSARHAGGTGIVVPSTGNAMIGRDAVLRLGLRFDTMLGAAGGEDTLFFRQAARGEVRTAWADAAQVHEHVVPGRLKLSRILRRQFAEGNSLARCDLHMSPTMGQIAMRCTKGVGLLGQGVLLLPVAVVRGMDGFARALSKLARGAGTITGLVGYRFEEYRRDRNLDTQEND